MLPSPRDHAHAQGCGRLIRVWDWRRRHRDPGGRGGGGRGPTQWWRMSRPSRTQPIPSHPIPAQHSAAQRSMPHAVCSTSRSARRATRLCVNNCRRGVTNKQTKRVRATPVGAPAASIPCPAQHSPAQPSPAHHSTSQHITAQHSTAQHSAAQRSAAQHATCRVQYVALG